MTERVFFDTNVIGYADDADSGPKRRRAEGLLRSHISARTAVVSTQVLQEYFVIATKKLGVDRQVARRKVELLAQLDVVVVRPEIILAAIDLQVARSLSFWDALVVRSAAAAGCARLLSEDMNDGEVIDGVRIENPFTQR